MLLCLSAIAQILSVSDQKIEIIPFGYLKAENFVDSRQVFGYFDNQLLSFPLRRDYDRFHRDINARPQGQMLAIESTFGCEMVPIEIASGIKAKGYIEAFFEGRDQLTVNILTLYRTYVQLESESTELLTGQYLHPLFVDDCYPKTVGFSNGSPIDSQDWEPQVRFTYKKNDWRIMATALSEFDSSSLGPIGYSSSYLRNAAIPNINILIKRIVDKHFFGVSLDYKKIAPRIVTDKNVKTTESVTSYAGIIFASLNFDKYTMRLKFIRAQNGTALGLISGYAIRTQDPITDIRSYQATNSVSAWVDGDYTFEDKHTIELGCFVGFTKNLGTHNRLCTNTCGQPTVYSICPNLATLFKIMPRVIYKQKPVDIAFELEIDHATFGELNQFALPINTRSVNSMRVLLAAYYRF
jgi:hypothetical protein